MNGALTESNPRSRVGALTVGALTESNERRGAGNAGVCGGREFSREAKRREYGLAQSRGSHVS